MQHKNPVHAAIYKSVVKPAISNRKMDIEGSVQRVNYHDQTLRVYWRDPDSGAERETDNVPMPIDGNGVFRHSIEEGDRVSIAFRNGNHSNPYITMIHKRARGISYESKNGAGIPKGMGFL